MTRKWPALRVAGSSRTDLLLAAALTAYAQVEIWWNSVAIGSAGVVGDKAVLVSTSLPATLSLALRRRFPLAVVGLVAGALVAQAALTDESEGLSVVPLLLVAIYSVAAHSERRRALIGLVVSVAALLFLAEDPADVPFDAIIAFAPWAAGRGIRQGRLRNAQLEDLTVQLEREREENARHAVAAERARIARELHDLVAHSVGVMVVQAGGARRLLEPEQQRLREALESVERTGREALAEMRRLLGVLRTEGAVPLTPPPNLSRVDALAEQLRQSGLPVEVRIEGEVRKLAPAIDLSAYRIVQEALTNTMKHAGPARAEVLIRYEQSAVEVVVQDDGRGPVNGSAGGHGLVGMRERVALFGGELQAGAREAGGFSVRARLPIEPSAP